LDVPAALPAAAPVPAPVRAEAGQPDQDRKHPAIGDAVRALADQIHKARVLHGGLCHAVAMNASQ
jgi:hypothetical protein